MSAIADYSDLLVAVSDYAGKPEITHLFPRFLALAEAKLNRSLRLSKMEDTATVTVTAGVGDLPDDFLEARVVYGANKVALSGIPLSVLIEGYANRQGGGAVAFCIQGDTLRVAPVWTGSLTLEYYAAIPALTTTNKTNWLLTLAPDLYISALVEQVAIWSGDAEKVAASRAIVDDTVRALHAQDGAKRFSVSRVIPGRGINP